MSFVLGPGFPPDNLMHFREGKVQFRKKQGTLEDFTFPLPKLKPHLDLLFQSFHGSFLCDVLFEPIPVFLIRYFHLPVKGLLLQNRCVLLL